MAPVAAVNRLLPPSISSVVRKDTCPHACGFTDNPAAVFDHRAVCQKGRDMLMSKVNFYCDAHDISGGRSRKDRECQRWAKCCLARHKMFQKAVSLQVDGRTRTDKIQLDASAIMHSHASEGRDLVERLFSGDDFLLFQLEKGRLHNPYDLDRTGRGSDPRLDTNIQPPVFGESASLKKRRLD